MTSTFTLAKYASPVFAWRRAVSRLLVSVALGGAVAGQAAGVKLLNVSYDVTREFYQELNPVFAADYKDKTGDVVTIRASKRNRSLAAWRRTW